MLYICSWLAMYLKQASCEWFMAGEEGFEGAEAPFIKLATLILSYSYLTPYKNPLAIFYTRGFSPSLYQIKNITPRVTFFIWLTIVQDVRTCFAV